VKKLLQSQKINWQQIPVLSIGSAQANYLISANITPQLNSIASSVIGSMTLNYTTPTYNIHSASLEDIMRPDHSDKYIRSGIYRDKAKFVVIYVDRKNSMSHLKRRVRYSSMASSSTTGEDDKSPPNIYNLGRYDTEEEAKRVYQKVSWALCYHELLHLMINIFFFFLSTGFLYGQDHRNFQSEAFSPRTVYNKEGKDRHLTNPRIATQTIIVL
jgi:hypothetical protein